MNTKALRQKILDLAIRGKLVPQDPNDEPAEVLLERIREQKQQMFKEGKLKKKDIKNDTIIFKGEDNLHYEKFQDGTVKCIEDEIPFEVPKGWEWARLASICSLISDIDHKMPKAVDNGVLFLSAKDLLNDGTINYTDDVKMISEDDFLRLSRKALPQKDDIIYSRIGACLGKARVVTKDIRFLVSYSCCTIRPVIIDSAFLASILDGNFVLDQAKEGTQSVGVPDLGMASIKQFLIPIPPLVEQQRIDKCLQYTLDIIQQISNERNDLSRMVAQIKSKILDLAIRGKLVPQDPNDEPASVLLDRIRAEKEELIKQGKIKRDKKESVIFKGEDNSYYLRTGRVEESLEDWRFDDLPKTWKICCLGELCDYGDCINVNTEDIAEDAWILDLEDIEKDTGTVLKKVTKDQRNSVSTKHKFHSGQVLYSKLRPYLNKVVLSDADGYCTSEILPLEFKNCVLPEYARYYLMSGTFITYANHCSYGVKMPRLGTTDGKKAIFSLPPLSEQKRIVETIDFCFMQLNKISEALA